MESTKRNEVNAWLFYDAVSKVSAALGKSKTSPVLGNVKIIFNTDRCVITSTNLEHWLEADIPACGESFSFILSDTKSMLKTCKYFDESILFEMIPDGTKVVLTSGNRVATQDYFVSEYPEYPEVDSFTASYTANAKTLSDRINKVKYAAADDNHARPVYTGVCFTGENVVALDGYRIAINKSSELNFGGEFILLVKSLTLLEAFGNDDITIEVSDNYVWFSNHSGTKLCVRRIAGEYVKIQNVIPADEEIKETYSVNTAEYLKELRYLYDMIGLHKREYIKFSNGNLKILTGRGDFSTRINVDGSAETAYGFECKYMLDALNHLKNAKNITVKIANSYKPIIMTDNQANTVLVLPILLEKYDRRSAA